MRTFRYGLLILLLIQVSACSQTKPRQILVRTPVYGSATQNEIDRLREAEAERTKMGRSERKPWNERYRGEIPNLPYQGPVGGERTLPGTW